MDLDKTIDETRLDIFIKCQKAEVLRKQYDEILLKEHLTMEEVVSGIVMGQMCNEAGINITSIVCPRLEFERRKDNNEL